MIICRNCRTYPKEKAYIKEGHYYCESCLEKVLEVTAVKVYNCSYCNFSSVDNQDFVLVNKKVVCTDCVLDVVMNECPCTVEYFTP